MKLLGSSIPLLHTGPDWFKVNDTAGNATYYFESDRITDLRSIQIEAGCDPSPCKSNASQFVCKYRPNYLYNITVFATCGTEYQLKSSIIHIMQADKNSTIPPTNFTFVKNLTTNESELQFTALTDDFSAQPIKFKSNVTDEICLSNFQNYSSYFTEASDSCNSNNLTTFVIPIGVLPPARIFDVPIYVCYCDGINGCENDLNMCQLVQNITSVDVPNERKRH